MDPVSTTTTVGSSTVSTTHPVLTGDALAAIIGALLFLALLVLLSPPALSWLYNLRRQSHEASGSTPPPASFFQINYITWYLLHSTVAALVIIGVVILALDGVLDAAVVSAILGSLLGYVLGSASQHSVSKPDPGNPPSNQNPPAAATNLGGD